MTKEQEWELIATSKEKCIGILQSQLADLEEENEELRKFLVDGVELATRLKTVLEALSKKQT